MVFMGKEYKNFREFYNNIEEIKTNVINLDNEALIQVKKEFYKLPISEFRKDNTWEYIWDDISKDQYKKIMQY